MNEATKKLKIRYNYSYLIIAKSTMLDSDYTNIKELIFQSFNKIK